MVNIGGASGVVVVCENGRDVLPGSRSIKYERRASPGGPELVVVIQGNRQPEAAAPDGAHGNLEVEGAVAEIDCANLVRDIAADLGDSGDVFWRYAVVELSRAEILSRRPAASKQDDCSDQGNRSLGLCEKSSSQHDVFSLEKRSWDARPGRPRRAARTGRFIVAGGARSAMMDSLEKRSDE